MLSSSQTQLCRNRAQCLKLFMQNFQIFKKYSTGQEQNHPWASHPWRGAKQGF